MAHGKDIDTLLDLDGVMIEQAGGCWIKFEVRRISKPTEEIPHGIRYSLTLHDRHGERIMGFDNAHGVKSRKKASIKVEKSMTIVTGIQKMRESLMNSLMLTSC